MNQNTISISRSKSGLPTLWERGGGVSHGGHAVIVAAQDGAPLRPIFVRTQGHLSCGEHALFVIKVGTIVVQADQKRGDYTIRVGRVASIDGDDATLDTLATFSQGVWDNPDAVAQYGAAIAAARSKARCYHCRAVHYAQPVPRMIVHGLMPTSADEAPPITPPAGDALSDAIRARLSLGTDVRIDNVNLGGRLLRVFIYDNALSMQAVMNVTGALGVDARQFGIGVDMDAGRYITFVVRTAP